jgi:hypothetical protein
MSLSLLEVAPATAATVAAAAPSATSAVNWAKLHTVRPADLSAQQALAEGVSRAQPVPHLAPQLYTVAGVVGASASSDGSTPVLADGSVEVTVSGTAAATAIRAGGGTILASAAGKVTAAVRPSALLALAAAPGVDNVAPISQAFADTSPVSAGTVAVGDKAVGDTSAGDSAVADSATAESVHSSMADVWQAAGQSGAGAVVAVVDEGFQNLAAEVAAGNLPASTVVNGNHCADVNRDEHGTAVAEIVHQMAPSATLLLYCVDDTIGLADAGSELIGAGAKVVSCSLGFAPDARGDGTGVSTADYTSADVTVARVRKAGILWVNAAGNSAQDHWAGTFTDRNHDGWSDLNTASDDFDQVLLSPGDSTEIVLSWDQWPSSTLAANVRVDEFNADSGASLGDAIGSRDSDLPNSPVRVISLTNSTSADELLDIRVALPKNAPALHYDLSYLGDVSSSYYSTRYPARAAAGSVTEPAASPYSLAVGAAFQGSGALEGFSSRGPTLDGRAKPDITGFDGVSSNLSAFSTGFFGTSAAAPNVAGAAALVVAANRSMDASQIQAFLQGRAANPSNPPNNATGHGVLSLGQPSAIAPGAGSGFSAITPVRVLDTRSGIGGRKGPIGAGQALVVQPPASVPADATAVVINLTGTGAAGATYLSVYPSSYPGTSNLNLSKSDSIAAVSATVALSPTHTFMVRNAGHLTHVVIDVLGYYAPTGMGYGAVSPFRALDTRTTLGGHHGKVTNNEAVRVSLSTDSQIPANATAVVINLTATDMTAAGYVSAAASQFTRTSTLNYSARNTRANLAVVGLAGRSFEVRNTGAPVDLIVDVVGYYSATATGKFHALPSPVRIADTRTGNGGLHTPVANRGRLNVYAAGLNGVPYSATAIVGSVVVVPTGTGNLSVFAAGATPRSSTVNYSVGRIVPNAFVTGVSGGVFTAYNAGNPATVAIDEVGYFSGS